MNFFKTEIKLNPTYVASTRITIEARRYRKKSNRWYAELNSGFHIYGNLAEISGDLATIKKVVAYWTKEHTAK